MFVSGVHEGESSQPAIPHCKIEYEIKYTLKSVMESIVRYGAVVIVFDSKRSWVLVFIATNKVMGNPVQFGKAHEVMITGRRRTCVLDMVDTMYPMIKPQITT